MLKHLITITTLLFLIISITAQDDPEMDTKTLHIAPYQQNCIGEAPQDCMVIRWDDETDLSLFYDAIDGFEFEEGYEYTLLVNVTERENVPADASSLQYELVEVVQKYPAQLDGKVWELQSLNGVDVEDSTRYTLLVTEDGIVMKADCNTVHANLTMNPFDIETTISTKVMCPPDSLDSDYLEGLNNTSLMSIENGELILQSSEGQLRFAPPAITDQEWKLIRVADVDITDETPYTLKIEDTAVLLTLNCNSGSGTAEFDGAVLHFTDVISTLMGCLNDPAIGMFPPENAVYSINEAGHLILVDETSTIYEFVSTDTQ